MLAFEHRFGSRLLLTVHLLGWFLILVIYVSIFESFTGWGPALLRGLINTVSLAALFYLHLILLRRWFENEAVGRYGLGLAVGFLFVTGLRTVLNLSFPSFPPATTVVQQPLNWLIGAGITNLAVVLVSGLYHMLDVRYRAQQRALVLQSEQQEAQLRFLRNQINPHFLFNTLHNIYSLAVVRSNKTAPMILKLSHLLRYVIYDGQSGRVRLQQEIDQIQALIDLFQMRSETPRDIRLTVQGEPAHLTIEPMVLVPLIENCCKHGDLDTNPDAYVRIELVIQADELKFHALNTKDPRDRQKDRVGGVGLANIRKRLELRYPHRHRFVVEDRTATFSVRLSIHGLAPDEDGATHPTTDDHAYH